MELLVLLISALIWPAMCDNTYTIDVLMPNVAVTQADQYFCTSVKVGEKDGFVVEFKPIVSMERVHHMLLYGCKKPGTMSKTWDCGEGHGPCASGTKIMFAWARDAPALAMPRDVGFAVGPSADIDYLVVNLHYSRKLDLDSSGVQLVLTPEPLLYHGGIMLLMSGSISVPPHSENVNVDISCRYVDDSPITVFAFRTHAHSLGRVIAGYRLRDGNYTEVGHASPQWAQTFYPLPKPVELRSGDVVMARCTYDSDRDTVTRVGPTARDEMCNLYLMFYAPSGDPYRECTDNAVPDASSHMPADSMVVPPSPRPPMKPTTPSPKPKPGSQPSEDYFTDVEQQRNRRPPTLQLDNSFVTDPNFGQVAGLAVDQSGALWAIHRGNRVWDGRTFDESNVFNDAADGAIMTPVLVQLDKTGKVVRSIGAGVFYLPHGLFIDGANRVWTTDVALHQVIQLDMDGKVIRKIGEALKPGSDENHFCKPADVTVLPDGRIVVADGYCNSRIVLFSPEGKFIKQMGSAGAGTGQFLLPHALAYAGDRGIYVADRLNGRIQTVDIEAGRVTGVIPVTQCVSEVYAVAAAKDGRLFVACPKVGFVIDVNGTVLSNIEGMSAAHDLAVTRDALFVAEIGPNRVLKFLLDGPIETHSIAIGTHVVEPPAHDSSMWTSLMIMLLLTIPVVVIVVGAIIVRMRKGKRPRLDLGQFLSRDRTGFEKLQQESDSEVEEYTVTPPTKA